MAAFPGLATWQNFYVIVGSAAAALSARSYAEQALFGVATSTLLLLFIGIHNAWDSVTYMIVTHGRHPDAEPKQLTKHPRR